MHQQKNYTKRNQLAKKPKKDPHYFAFEYNKNNYEIVTEENVI